MSRTQRDASGAQGTGGGGEVDFQIPIFDFGEVRLREAGETYMQAVNRLTEKAVNVRSEAREAYQAYRSALRHRRSTYRGDVLPLRKIISDETMLRYGAMQIDVFALLTEARQRIAVEHRRNRSAARLLARRSPISTPRSPAAAMTMAPRPRLRPAPRIPRSTGRRAQT